MKIISLACSWLQLSSLLFVTSLYYFFEVFVVSLTVCCVNALFSAAAVSYSRFPMFHYLFLMSPLCSRLQLLHILFVTSDTISSKFPLFHCLFVTSLQFFRLRLFHLLAYLLRN